MEPQFNYDVYVLPPNIENIELIFPVPGHSFLPPPVRVFGRTEKVLRKEPTITDPRIYLKMFHKHGTNWEKTAE